MTGFALPHLEDTQVGDVGGVLTSGVAGSGLPHYCVRYCKSSKPGGFVWPWDQR